MNIRFASVGDAEAILKIYAPYVEKTAVTFEYDVPDVSAFRGRIRKTRSEYPYLVAEDDGGEIIGYAYAGAFHARAAYRHCAEVSIYVDHDCRRQGVGRVLYEELERLLQRQNVFILYACITCTDRADDEHLTDGSIRFHKKMGYTQIGRHELCGYKFEKWYSVIWMEKLIAERPEKPAPFKPFTGRKESREHDFV